MTPLELADALFGEDPSWPTPSAGDGPEPFDLENAEAWWLMVAAAQRDNRALRRSARQSQGAARV